MNTCEIYQEGTWMHLQNTTAWRQQHSSAARGDAVLLIGGLYSNTTEWIPVNGSTAQLGPFTVRHGQWHCTMQISDDLIVVTGGRDTQDFVTHYQLDDGTETYLTQLARPRYGHACGFYQDADDQWVRKGFWSCKEMQCAENTDDFESDISSII